MENSEEFEIVIKTHQGLEEILEKEAQSHGLNNTQIITRGVKGTGNLETLYRCNIACRTAMSVLVTVSDFTASDPDELYQKAVEIPWEKHFGLTKTFAIKGIIHADYIKNTQYPVLRLKDAVADRFSQKFGERPSIEKENPDVTLQLLVRDTNVTVSIDTSGETLNKRGYRVKGLGAPINEALAAGIIMHTEWKGESDFYDPFCGSGTLLTEAALIASNTAPNLSRTDFCLKNLKNFNSELWFTVLEDLKSKITEPKVQFYGADKFRGAVETTRKHWLKLGFDLRILHLTHGDFQQLTPKGKEGIVITNPPYGKRISEKGIKYLYRDLGNLFKRKFTGFTAAVISGSEEGLKNLGLRPAKKVNMFNGPIESKLYIFDLYSGSKKQGRSYDPRPKYGDKKH